jgi:hypothetical protein
VKLHYKGNSFLSSKEISFTAVVSFSFIFSFLLVNCVSRTSLAGNSFFSSKEISSTLYSINCIFELEGIVHSIKNIFGEIDAIEIGINA